MLATRFQPRLQTASARRARPAGRTAALWVVAFKNGDEEQQAVQQAVSKAKVTFQLPLHVEWGQEVALVGAAEGLGSWDVEKSIPMSWNDGDMWTAQAEVPIDTPIEYKYIIRAGEGEVKAVVQWQPCNNLELQAAAEQPELTIRDAWEGEQHDVLPGTLPLPAPPAPEPQPDIPEAPVAAFEAVPEPESAPATIEAPEAVAAPEPVAPVAAEPAPASPVVAEAPAAAPAAAPAKAEPEVAAAAAPAAPAPARRCSSTTSRAANGAKPSGGNSARANKVVAAAATEGGAPQVKYGSLTTNELKEVCKERGLSTKGQRRDLLSRLQQLLKGNQA